MLNNIKTLVLDLDVATFDKCNIESLILQEYENLQQQKTNQNTVAPVTPKHEEIAQLAWDYKDAYNAYNSIERHIQFSESLYNLNKRGHHFLDEIRRTKYQQQQQQDVVDVDPLVDSVVYSIVSIVRSRLMGTSTLMNELYCYLEETMFHDVDSAGIDAFYIDDDEYPLTALYYSQESWLTDLDIQSVQFTKGRKLDEGEVMMLIVFFNDYQSLLDKIAEATCEYHTDSHKRLDYTTGKIATIIERVKTHLLEQIEKAFPIT